MTVFGAPLRVSARTGHIVANPRAGAVMEELIREWDGECVVVRFDQQTGAWIFIALHDRTLGPALGGCRLTTYASPAEGLRDAMRLARGMTLKWAALDLPFGGGKAVLAVPGPFEPEDRERLLLRFGTLVESLGGIYGTGADLGTTPADMDVIGRRTRHVCGRTPAQGGHGDPGPWTALGVLSGMRAACELVFGDASLAGRSVLVQGLGGVGRPLSEQLAADGARLLVADAIPSRTEYAASEFGATPVAPDRVYDTDCDIFAPCAIGGVLNARSIARLRCRIVAGSANNQLEEDADAERLHERGILYAPDFVINAGGAIAHATLELLDWTEEQMEGRVLAIETSLGEILGDAVRRGESPLHEAKARAARVLQRTRERRVPVEA
jgi:leucine dehydrogenase